MQKIKVNNFMPVISKKGLKMPESPIRKLVPYAENAKKKWSASFSSKHWTTRY